MPLADIDLLIVENVGDLLCQAAEDLGEHLRATVLSVSAGHRMATKYAPAYRDARLIIVTKCALLPHVEFEMQPTLDFLSRISPGAEIICTDTHARNGLGRLTGWLLGYVRVQHAPRALVPMPALGFAATTL
jgi:hydrogenase nickel incorporation protein HypB